MPSPEVSAPRAFSERWHMQTAVNATDMTQHDMGDHVANLSPCMKLDLLANETASSCFVAKAWMEDALLCNTGAMAASCSCQAANNGGCCFNWTRCDWRPEVFRGGKLVHTGPCLCSDVIAVDFLSVLCLRSLWIM
jgi:hypothetical protein